MADEVDGPGFSCFGNRNIDNPDKPANLPTGPNRIIGPGIDETEYKMDHPRRGVALIFNHTVFYDSNSPRAGSDIDCNSLKATLGKLNFEVQVHTNLKKREVFHALEMVAVDDHKNADCLVVVVMTHGDPDELCAYDTSYKVKNLWENFTSINCPSLAGKPKLFFIQACRGDRVDPGVRITPRVNTTRMDGSPQVSYTIPSVSDILIANATFDGYYAWRSGTTGSWFIQTLCKVLDEIGETKEICQILTHVNRRVAIQYASYVPDDSRKHNKKQMPNFLSTLTRELYFKPNSHQMLRNKK